MQKIKMAKGLARVIFIYTNSFEKDISNRTRSIKI